MRQLHQVTIRAVLAGLVSAALSGAPAAQTTLTLNVPTTHVVYIGLRAGSYAATNQRHDLETKTTTDASVVRRAILNFDTQNTIPAGSVITPATMTLAVNESGPTALRTIGVYQMTQSWDETQATWVVNRTKEKWLTAGRDLGTKLAQQAVGSAPAPPTALTIGAGTATLRVLEYNVHHGGIGTDGQYDPNRIVDWIVKMNPDVVSLCEMEANDSYITGDGVALYQSLLEQRTGQTWYTLDIQDYGAWTSAGIRNAIVSRYPILATYRHEFSIGKDRTVGGVTIAVNGRTINIASTHLDPDSRAYRTTQASELVLYLTGVAQDRILLGDFNDQPTEAPITAITDSYYDAWAEGTKAHIAAAATDNPNGYTRNSRIDYVFYSQGESHLTLNSVQVVDTRDANGYMPSDHRPLLATFTVQ